jgi:hypothetical protein
MDGAMTDYQSLGHLSVSQSLQARIMLEIEPVFTYF